MAVTDAGVVSITTTISKGTRVWNLNNGLKVAQVEIFLVNAASAMPVAGTLQLPRALWQRMGFSNIFAMPEIIMVKGTPRDTIVGQTQYDPQASTIKLNDSLGAAVPAATLGNGGSLRCLVFGF